jgi:hypothetical protein
MPYLGYIPPPSPVTTIDIQTGAIANTDLSAGAVTSHAIAVDAVTSAKIADDQIDSEHYAAASIDTAHIATNQIDGTLTKDALIADYSDVTITAADLIMYGDATDSNNTKRDTVQGVLDLVPAGGGFEFVSSSTASGSSTIAFTGLETGYDYQVQITGYYGSGSGQWARMRFGVTGPTYRTSGYQAVGAGLTAGASATGNGQTGYCPIFNAAMGDAAGEIAGGVVTIIDPANSGTETSYHGNSWIYNHVPTMHSGVTGGWYDSNEAHTAIQFDQVSGTMTVGKFDLYRRPNT